ncbi:MAG TPA: hypothetical protein VJ385_08130 [Fibrobacteria bacterium]|nr:hypothetical protein [Fibrobacteria bacterium]
MAIGVKETQEIIRQAAVLSRNEPAVPAKLDPQEVGMATGPRHRKRALLRAGPVPDYLDPGELVPDGWQKLDDDIYKFLQLRRDQFSRLAAPPSQQFIAEMEAQLRLSHPGYEPGSFLGLLRQAADLDQTRQTYVTASEKNTFHAFARRITEGRKTGEAFDPGMVKRYRDLLEANHPTTNRGLADLFRLVSRAARLPLIGSLREAPSLSVAVLLQVVDLSTRFNQNSQGSLEFQVGPMDVFLGARTVLFNRSVLNPTLSIVKELVLDETGLYHDDLLELLRNVGVFGSELTLLMPESLTEDGFALQGSTYSAVELVMAAGAKLAKGGAPVDRALTTLADAIVHKVQQQDSHKDKQIQSILSHFNRLLQGERRSAARVTEERQQARFDYMTAIQKASQLAKGMQTGRFPAMQAGENQARPLLAPRSQAPLPEPKPLAAFEPLLPPAPPAAAAPAVDDLTPMQTLKPGAAALDAPSAAPLPPDTEYHMLPLPPSPAAAVVGRITAAEYESLLGTWDTLLVRLRKKLTTKSPTFKSLASQLAKVRALDTCLAYGLTPAGGRATGRLAKLIQSEELRGRLGVPTDIAEAMEDAFSMDYPGFLASMESLIGAMYEFRPELRSIQFRLRDRLPSPRPGLVDMARAAKSGGSGDGRETTLWADASELDEVALRLLLGCILLGLEMAGGLNVSKSTPQFQTDGKLRFPSATGLAALGDSDPFLAYCTLLWVGKKTLGAAAEGDLETNLMLLIRLTPDERGAMKLKYREWIGMGNKPAALVPGLGETRVREGWLRGFERGFMAEMSALYDGTEGSMLERRLLEQLTAIQTDIDAASGVLEGEKMRLTRERVERILE